MADHDCAVYHRPPWMTDCQWQRVSAAMTEQWMILLEDQARRPVAGPGEPQQRQAR